MIHCSFFAQQLKITILLQTNFLFKVQRALAFLNQRTERERREKSEGNRTDFSTLAGLEPGLKSRPGQPLKVQEVNN